MAYKTKSNQFDQNNKVPVFNQIASVLKRELEGGVYPEGTRLPSNMELAKRFRVNHLTIRKALEILKDESLVTSEPGRGTFPANNENRILRIALILPTLGHESSGAIARGLNSKIPGEKFKVDIFDYEQNDSLEVELLKVASGDEYDAIIVYPSMRPHTTRELMKLMSTDKPIVFVEHFFKDVPCWSIHSQNFDGGYMATKHLIENGTQRPAMVTCDLTNVSRRLDGYRKALDEARIPYRDDLVKCIEISNEASAQATHELMMLEEPPDGIFYFNDFSAIAGIRVLAHLHLIEPRRVRVVGFDDISVASVVMPSLTTIRQDHFKLGELAATMIQDAITASIEERHSTKTIRIPVELIVRESSQSSKAQTRLSKSIDTKS